MRPGITERKRDHNRKTNSNMFAKQASKGDRRENFQAEGTGGKGAGGQAHLGSSN